MSDYEKAFLQLPGFCKYFSDSLIDKIFVDKTLRFSQPWVLNDPLEFNPVIKINDQNEYDTYIIDDILMPSINDWFRMQLIESQINDYGILSLTKNPASFTMWNNYGNGHKGFVIEFDNKFNEHKYFKSFDHEIYPVEKVKYVDEFIIDLQKISDDTGSFSMKDFNEYYFYSKTKRWRYEEEYRLVRNLRDFNKEFKNAGSYRGESEIYSSALPFKVINSITFGAHMSKENKSKIIKLLKNTDIGFLQAYVYKDEKDAEGEMGRVELIPLVDPEMLKTILKLEPQVFSVEGRKFDKRKKVTLCKIEDLPYFYNYKDLVIEMFKKKKQKKEKNPI